MNPYPLEIAGKPFNLILSASGPWYVLEFEPAESDSGLNVEKMIGRSIAEMLADKNLSKLLGNMAMQVRKIIHYDRVMIYRFAADGHGEVVGEDRDANLESWLGLHYPASDIPRQARDLYKINLTRLIADVQSKPSAIRCSEAGMTLDLTSAQLRAVSPIHIQYLKNMGVASSFSISLLYRNELWGLIACHNYTPRFIDYSSRESAKLIGQILSSALEFRQEEENQRQQEIYKAHLEKLGKNMQGEVSLNEALLDRSVTLIDLVDCSGAALLYDKKCWTIGKTPGEVELGRLADFILEHAVENQFHTDELQSVFPEASAYRQTGSGLLACILSREFKELVFWFKPEKIQTIRWAGNPEKPVETGPGGLSQISPRNSFEVWSQHVSGRSDAWSAEELGSALALKEEITYALNQKAGALRSLNEKLKTAYEELDTFSYTISHDLKNPITVIKSYSQLLLQDESLSERHRHILLRMVQNSDRMNLMIGEVLNYSRIGRTEIQFRKFEARKEIDEIIADLRLVYTPVNFDIHIGDTPDIQGDPVMLYQVFSNLISNAVKYSQDAAKPSIHISGHLEPGMIHYEIKDNGRGIPTEHLDTIFELFKRMDNVKDIDGSGVGLAIVKRIVGKHEGQIWAESIPGAGSTFHLLFKQIG